MGRKIRRRRKRHQNLGNSTLIEELGLLAASTIAREIIERNSILSKRREDHDISLAAILSIQFWRQMSVNQGDNFTNILQAAFCRFPFAKKLQTHNVSK